METAAYFARKHGLEQYLDMPEELNEMILKLLVLQESLQHEQARKANAVPDGCSVVDVRRKMGGRFSVRCTGATAYRYAVETALRESTFAVPLFQQGRFAALLRQMGVPDERIAEFCATVVVDDDIHSIDPE